MSVLSPDVAGGSSAGTSGPLEISLCQKMIFFLCFLGTQPARPICTKNPNNNKKTPKPQAKPHHPTPKSTKPEQTQSNKKQQKNLTQQNQNGKKATKKQGKMSLFLTEWDEEH